MESKRLYTLLYVAFFFFSTAIVARTSDHELQALILLKASLADPDVLSSWNRSSPHCSWLDVLCRLGRVDSIALPTQSLTGRLSALVAAFSSFTLLDLSWNFFSGQIQPEVASLRRLSQLLLGVNQLTDEVPSWLGELTELWMLKLGPNSLTGEIPPEIGKLVQLEILDLSCNSLVGAVPAELGNLTKLPFLDLSSNFLSVALWELLFPFTRRSK